MILNEPVQSRTVACVASVRHRDARTNLVRVVSALVRLLQGFDQEENFGGHRVVQIWRLGESTVAAAADDGLEGADERDEPRGIGVGGELLDEGRGLGRLAGEQGLGYRE